ncbi:hypothetical protein HPP92_012191 [Vanilla planifolia]|uniref:C2H2-type domain-containing protein n=1 Tax=Vanilla planifolia TaxID=51239 RepID=A0A835RDU4_VANPL|nr:hypothetical protein HPP92_012191 [Vanilla planifolia]
MKRFRLFDEEEELIESFNLANVLMLLSRGKQIAATATDVGAAVQRVFECKTCNRQFPSFQALGGHRASHKKPKPGGAAASGPPKARMHECSVCGLEFAIGQALGGHMRRHRASAEERELGFVGDEVPEANKTRGGLDLNLPPPIVDCSY